AIDRSPAVRMAEAVEIEALAGAAHVETERAIEALGDVEIGHGEHKAMQRMHRGDARSPWQRGRELLHGCLLPVPADVDQAHRIVQLIMNGLRCETRRRMRLRRRI